MRHKFLFWRGKTILWSIILRNKLRWWVFNARLHLSEQLYHLAQRIDPARDIATPKLVNSRHAWRGRRNLGR